MKVSAALQTLLEEKPVRPLAASLPATQTALNFAIIPHGGKDLSTLGWESGGDECVCGGGGCGGNRHHVLRT